MSPLRVFPDTGVLLAMIVFPRDRGGTATLAGEVLELYAEGAFEIVLGQAVIDELDEVLDARFTAHRPEAVAWLQPHLTSLVRWPTPEEIIAVLPHCADPADAPIFATAILARPEIVLANDFQSFHRPEAKALWQANGMAVESLYGLLCRFGRRVRKDETIQDV